MILFPAHFDVYGCRYYFDPEELELWANVMNHFHIFDFMIVPDPQKLLLKKPKKTGKKIDTISPKKRRKQYHENQLGFFDHL
jgi:hypothetical protein